MKVEFIGNATVILHQRNARILCDPWLVDGAWGGTWYHFPSIEATPQDIAGRIDYMFISHIHEDHCDRRTLEHFSRDIPILCLDRSPNFVANMVQEMGFSRIIKARPFEPVDVDGKFTFSADGATEGNLPASLVDSTGIFVMDGQLVVHCNDNYPDGPFRKGLLSNFKNPDLLLMPTGGGSAYPAMYTNLTHEEKLAKRGSILAGQQDRFCEALSELRPRYTVPVGGGFLVAGKYGWTNQYMCKPYFVEDVFEECRRRGHQHTQFVPMQEPMTFDPETGLSVGTYQRMTVKDREDFLTRFKDVDYPSFLSTSSPLQPQSLQRLFPTARARMWEAQQRLGLTCDYHIYINYGGPQLLHLDCASPEVEEVDAERLVEPYLKIQVTPEDLLALFTKATDWNVADGSYRLTFHRQPEMYEDRAYALLSFLHI